MSIWRKHAWVRLSAVKAPDLKPSCTPSTVNRLRSMAGASGEHCVPTVESVLFMRGFRARELCSGQCICRQTRGEKPRAITRRDRAYRTLPTHQGARYACNTGKPDSRVRRVARHRHANRAMMNPAQSKQVQREPSPRRRCGSARTASFISRAVLLTSSHPGYRW